MIRHLSACFTFALALQLSAAFIRTWSIAEIENSPALVTATVLRVEAQEVVQPGLLRWKRPARYWEATLRVHRAYAQGPFPNDTTLTVRYVGPLQPGSMISSSPVWPHFQPGMTALFPLAPTATGKWRLLPDEGFNLTVPAITSAPHTTGRPGSGRSFLLAELAHALAHGDPFQRHAAAAYLRRSGTLPDAFRELLAREVGTNEDIWLSVAAATLASRGIPQPGITELMSNPTMPGVSNQLAAWALLRGATRDYPNRLIRCLLRDMAAFEWGASHALLNFKDTPFLLRQMQLLLTRDPSASIYAANVLIRNGQHAFLQQALAAATTLVSAPGPVPANRLQAASSLLLQHGSDAQFNLIPFTLRRLKLEDEPAYAKLFLSVNSRQSKRELRVALVLIDDRRSGFGTHRYCDEAAALVQALSGEHFGIKPRMTTHEWDRAVALAGAWLHHHRTGY